MGITLITGGTGKTGRRIADRLLKMNQSIRIGSRSAEPKFDWDDRATWNDALHGISNVYIAFQPDLAVPGAVETIRAFVDCALGNNVKKIVLLSGRGEKEAEQCEAVVMSAEIDATVIRASWFMQNFSENFLVDSIHQGHVVLPTVTALEPFVDADDIADVVVAALMEPGHTGKIYELTGPALLSFEKAVSLMASLLGSSISYESVSMDDYTATLRSHHVPEDFIWLVRYLFTEVLDGRNESITHDVEKVLGRKPTSFETYVAKTLKTGVWNTQHQ